MAMPALKLHTDYTRAPKTMRRGGSTVGVQKLSADELWLLTNPRIMASVMDGIQQAKRGEIVDLGSFAECADIDVDEE